MTRSQLLERLEITANVLDSNGMRTLRLDGMGKGFIVFHKPNVGAWGFKVDPAVTIPAKMAALLYLKGWPYEQ